MKATLLAFALLGGSVRGTELPFVLVGSTRIWKAVEVQKLAAPQIVCEKVFTRAQTHERFVVLRCSRSAEEVISLDDFAAELRDSFTGKGTAAKDERAHRMGFDGRELQFQLTSTEGTFSCVLFAFTADEQCWAVLHTQPAGNGASPFRNFSVFAKRPVSPPGVAVMEPLKIVDDAISDYPIGFKIAVHSGTTQVGKIVVTDVPPDSQSSRAGIKIGDEILTINGRSSTTFTAEPGRTGELGRIFLNRRLGDKVFLELMSADNHATYSAVLTVEYYAMPWRR